ncbi:MAG: type II secretion system protein [Verrucomicrobiales bacterium]
MTLQTIGPVGWAAGSSTARIRARRSGFSLVELLIVIAVIGILASIVISNMSNAAQDSRRIVARQQQVVLQSAINNWVAQACTTSSNASLSTVRTAYNTPQNALGRLSLIRDYLDADTYNHFATNTSDAAKVQSDAMKRAGKWIELPAWGLNSYPQVDLKPIN